MVNGNRNNSRPQGKNGRKAQNNASKIPRGLQIHKFSRHVDDGILLKSAADTGWAYAFNLTDLPSNTEFTNLFDRWRIVNIEATWIYQQSVNSATFCFPTLYASIDLNDANTPLIQNTILERENAKIMPFSAAIAMHKVNFKPRTLVQGVAGSLAVEVKDGWADCLVPGQDFFGLKFWIQNYNTAVSGAAQVRLLYRYDLEFQTAK